MSRVADSGTIGRAPVRAIVRARRAVVAALVLAASTAVAATAPAVVAAEEQAAAFLGILPMPPNFLTGGHVAGVDPERKLVYVTYSARVAPPNHTVGPVRVAEPGAATLQLWLATFDARTAVPTLLSTRAVPDGHTSMSAYWRVLDPANRRLIHLATNDTRQSVDLIKLDGGPKTSWDLHTVVPGLTALGLTYSPEDRRIYIVGKMVLPYSTDLVGEVYPRPSIVVALDSDTGALAWTRLLPECQGPLYSKHRGSLIARSSPALATPTLFVPCAASGSVVGESEPAQSALLEVRFAPGAGAAEAAQFEVRAHPISGQYHNTGKTGIAAFDPGTDRVFMQSLSMQTPGAWVFDARMGGWVGMISSPSPANYHLGVNPTNGHYYMGGGNDTTTNFLLITDGRTTPPQNGRFADARFAPHDIVVPDPGSDRIFVSVNTNSRIEIAVLRDLLPSVRSHDGPDYDAQTDDVAESPDSSVAYTGDVGGFGSKLTVVGGATAPLANVETLKAQYGGSVSWPDVPVRRGTRALSQARVPSVTLQASAAGAAAAAGSVDTATANDLGGMPAAGRWPYEDVTCLDGGGGDDPAVPPATGPGGRAEVTCALAEGRAAAAAEHAKVAAQGVSISRSTFDTTTRRTAAAGVTTETTATSRGITVDVPGTGSLTVAEATSIATTRAHGRRGTAKAEFTRRISGVVVKNPAGGVVFRSDGCETTLAHDGQRLTTSGDRSKCDQLAEAVRKALQVRVRLLFPEPLVRATPKGAFASVGQTDRDYFEQSAVTDQGKIFTDDTPTRRPVPGLQLDVYNDGPERSRFVVQLAGIEASSIFTVNSSTADPDCVMGGCTVGLDDPGSPGSGHLDGLASGGSDPMSGGIPSVASSDGAGLLGGGSRGSTGRVPGLGTAGDGLVFARRSLGDAAMLLCLFAVFAAASGSVVRRRRLLEVLRPG